MWWWCVDKTEATLANIKLLHIQPRIGVYDSKLKQFTQREVSSNNRLNAKYSGTQGSAQIANKHKTTKNIQNIFNQLPSAKRRNLKKI